VSSREPLRILFSFPTRLGSRGVGTTAWHQAAGLADLGAEVRIVCGSVERDLHGVPLPVETMRVPAGRIPYRAVGFDRATAWHDWRAARAVRALAREIDLVHAWPGGAERTLLAARECGVPSLLERPNAHTAFAFEAVAAECERLGIEVEPGSPHAYDAARLAREEREFAAAGYLLCPSDFVAATHRDRGAAEARLLRHQYGYDPCAFAPRERPAGEPPAVLFAGRGEPRKGLHLALRAWLDSPLAEGGRFLVMGAVDPGYRAVLAPLLAHPGVRELGAVADPSAVMAEADILILPSLEEGSALVTYEARGSGCVLVVSDRTGAVCRHGADALVHPAGDLAVLTAQLRELAHDRERLERLRAASLRGLPGLTWTAAARSLHGAYERALAAAPATALAS
jgi:glycosyltransferase involved in cell wall biosynthesis